MYMLLNRLIYCPLYIENAQYENLREHCLSKIEKLIKALDFEHFGMTVNEKQLR